MTRKPRLLIGSTSEALSIAGALQSLLAPDIESQLWSQDFFDLGDTTIETLEHKIRAFDGAVILATADDRVIVRGEEHPAVRDNLLFEFGLFTGVLGRRRSLLVVERLGETKLPTDLLGLTCIGFQKSNPIEVTLGPVASRLRSTAVRWASEAIDPDFHERINRLLRIALGRIQAITGVTSDLGIHVYAVDERESPPVLARVGRARSSPKAPRRRDFASGEGITGRCWETASSVHVDFRQEPYASATSEDWERLGIEVRGGMSYDLLDESRKRYSLVAAHPIISQIPAGFGFLGCVAMNLGANSSADPQVLRTPEVERVMDDCVEMIAVLLEIA